MAPRTHQQPADTAPLTVGRDRERRQRQRTVPGAVVLDQVDAADHHEAHHLVLVQRHEGELGQVLRGGTDQLDEVGDRDVVLEGRPHHRAHGWRLLGTLGDHPDLVTWGRLHLRDLRRDGASAHTDIPVAPGIGVAASPGGADRWRDFADNGSRVH